MAKIEYENDRIISSGRLMDVPVLWINGGFPDHYPSANVNLRFRL